MSAASRSRVSDTDLFDGYHVVPAGAEAGCTSVAKSRSLRSVVVPSVRAAAPRQPRWAELSDGMQAQGFIHAFTSA